MLNGDAHLSAIEGEPSLRIRLVALFSKTGTRASYQKPRPLYQVFAPDYQHRILYVGRDHALFACLDNALKRLGCFVVRCPDDYQARLFPKSDIKYSLLLFNDNPPDAESARFARTLKHRQHTPILFHKESSDFAPPVKTVRRLLNG
jgi:hypothetical protein